MEQNRDHHAGASANITSCPPPATRLEYRPPPQVIGQKEALIGGPMDMSAHSNIHTPLCADAIPVGLNRDRSICNFARSVGPSTDMEFVRSQS